MRTSVSAPRWCSTSIRPPFTSTWGSTASRTVRCVRLACVSRIAATYASCASVSAVTEPLMIGSGSSIGLVRRPGGTGTAPAGHRAAGRARRCGSTARTGCSASTATSAAGQRTSRSGASSGPSLLVEVALAQVVVAVLAADAAHLGLEARAGRALALDLDAHDVLAALGVRHLGPRLDLAVVVLAGVPAAALNDVRP